MRSILLVGLLAGFAAIFYILLPSRDENPGGFSGARLQRGENVRVGNLRFREWDNERLRYAVDGKRARYYHGQKRASLEDVDVTVYLTSGRTVHVRADEVRYDLDTGNLTAEGNIEGESEAGYRFATGRLAYAAADRRVRTDDKVDLQKDRLHVRGRGMEGSLDSHTFTLLSDVRAEFAPGGAFPGRGSGG